MEEIAAVPVHPDLARVYIEEWQSWSATGLFPVGAPPPAVTDADSPVIDCQYRRSPPEGVGPDIAAAYEPGSGLLSAPSQRNATRNVLGRAPGSTAGSGSTTRTA